MAENESQRDADWEREEGVPSLSDPFIQKYLQGRDALVQQEKRQRSGRSNKIMTFAQVNSSLTYNRLPFPAESLANGPGGMLHSLPDPI